MNDKIILATPLDIIRVLLSSGLLFGILMAILLGFFQFLAVLLNSDGLGRAVLSGSVRAIIGGFLSAALIATLFGLFDIVLLIFKKYLFPKLNLIENERVLAEIFGNHMVENIMEGGRVFITTEGVRFIPHILNAYKEEVFINYGDITKVEETLAGFKDLFAGGLSTRLSISAEQQKKHLFIVWNSDRTKKAIESQMEKTREK